MGAQKGAVTCPGSRSLQVAEVGLEPEPSCPKALTMYYLLAGTPLQGLSPGEEERRGFGGLERACSPDVSL